MTATARQPRQDADLGRLLSLPRVLLREGYVDAYLVYGRGHLSFAAVQRDVGHLPSGTRELVELFLLNGFVARPVIAEILGDELCTGLEHLGVLLPYEGGRVHSGGLLALPHEGLVLLVPTPVADPAVYFGDDTVALAVRITPPRGARCLDLCAGPGTQALLAASRSGGDVVAVEINPIAAACAELNVAMNGFAGKVEVRRGDLYKMVREGERFDLVTANPPLLPFVPDLPYPFVGHGGGDGLAVTRKILDGLPGALAPGGTAQIIGTCLGNDAGPFPVAELTQYAERHRLEVVMTVPSRCPLAKGSKMLEGLVDTCAHAAGLKRDGVRELFLAHLAKLEADQLYLYYLTITQHAARAGFRVTEHYRRPGGFWFH